MPYCRSLPVAGTAGRGDSHAAPDRPNSAYGLRYLSMLEYKPLRSLSQFAHLFQSTVFPAGAFSRAVCRFTNSSNVSACIAATSP